MRVAVIGAGGQLAHDLLHHCWQQGSDLECTGLTHSEVEVADYASVEAALKQVRPEAVINTAAFHQLESCEADPQRAFEVNTRGAQNLALACHARGVRLVHMSTDYVFSGAKGSPYEEGDYPDPLNAYGASKAAGETFVRQHCPEHLIIRSSALYGVAGSSGKGGNFVQTMLRKARAGEEVRVVDDQVTSPTSTLALARQIVALLGTANSGTFHAVCHGACSWYEFAAEIFRQAGIAANLRAQSTSESGSRVRRPTYSVLRNTRLEQLGLDMMSTWQQALAEYLAQTAARA
jgi:dTDP-4-dehydrorhamnose reductase